MEQFLLVAAVCAGITLLGAMIQRVSGFGFGIVVMLVFPFLFSNLGEATTLSGLISVLSTSYLAIRYRKNISCKLLFWPLLAYIPLNYLAIWFVAKTDTGMLKMILGVFLALLSLYFLLFSSKITIKPTLLSGFTVGGLSGVLGGGFAMAGPPIAVYLLSATNADKLNYLATIQCYFAVTGIIATSGRIANGFLTQKVLLLLPIAVISVMLGNFLGGKIYKKINPNALKYCVYIFMAVAACFMVLSEILKR